MNEIPPSVGEILSDKQKEIFQSIFVMVRDSVGLFDAEYIASKASAARMYLELSQSPYKIRVDEVFRRMKANPEGARSLLCVILSLGYSKDWVVSLPEIAESKSNYMEMGGPAFLSAGADFVLRRAIQEYPCIHPPVA